MARGDLLCPNCGQVLGLPTIALNVRSEADLGRSKGVGGHCHVEVSGTFTCATGHRWTASGDFLLDREA